MTGYNSLIPYYGRLAIASFRRTPGITALMVLAIAIGIGACVVTLTIYHAMSGNPIWWKNDVLYSVTLDNWDPNEPANSQRPELPPDQMTYRDAEEVWRSDIPKNTAIMYRVSGIVSGEGPRGKIDAVPAPTRVTTADFFSMFDVPFQYGKAWNKQADVGPEPSIVLSRKLNEKVFAGENSVGRTLSWNDREFRVVGVLDYWEPQPKYYDLNSGNFAIPEEAYIPWKWGEALSLGSQGSSNCWKIENIESFKGFMNSECTWIQVWVELPDAAARNRMQAMLDNYTDQQRKSGRFLRPRNNRLTDVSTWLDVQGVVSSDYRVLVGLAFAFLAVCLINTIGLLLAKFLNAAPLSGVRRALGASRRDLFTQHMVEVSAIAMAGAVLALAFGALGLAGIRALYSASAAFTGTGGIRGLAHMDVSSYGVAVILAIVATLICGLYPAWRVGRLHPAAYLKNQ
jgi:putative ABC transport system permease protein